LAAHPFRNRISLLVVDLFLLDSKRRNKIDQLTPEIVPRLEKIPE